MNLYTVSFKSDLYLRISTPRSLSHFRRSGRSLDYINKDRFNHLASIYGFILSAFYLCRFHPLSMHKIFPPVHSIALKVLFVRYKVQYSTTDQFNILVHK